MTRVQAWIDIALFILLIFLASQGLALARAILPLPLPYTIILQGIFILFILYLMLRLRGQRWRDVGLLPFRVKDLGYALVALLSAYAVNFVLLSLFYWLDPEAFRAHIDQLTHVAERISKGWSYADMAAMMLFVGVYEELAARGFLLNRAMLALNSKGAAVLLSSVLFGLGHIYQGWIGVVQTTFIGIVFAIAVLRWQSLWPSILAHSGLNTIYLALAPVVEERLRGML